MFALDILNQYQSENGNVLAAGKLFIYKQGRTELAEIYSDINGSVELANPVILNNLGMTDTPVYLSRLYSYTVVCKNMYGEELFSRDIYPNIDSDAGPAISGYLYEGISPIVVNNVDKAISAINVPIGVQEPLYFVEDSSAACIIGIDSDAMVSGYVTSGDLATVSGEITAMIPSTAGLASEEYVNSSVSGKQDITGMTAYQVAGDYYSASNPSAFVTSGELSTVSADITAMIPTALTGDYLDKASADTLYYPLNTNPSGYLVEDDITGKQDVSAMTAYAQNSALTAQLALSGGNGVSLVEDYINDVLLINVTADGGDTAVNSLVHANSAAWNDVSSKLDSSSFANVSGDYLVGSNVSGFVITATGDGFYNGMTVAISQDTPFAGMYLSESDINGSKQIYIDPDRIYFYSAGEFSTAEEINAGDIAALKSLSSSKQDNLTFSYTPANEISAINSSAIAGSTGSSFPSSANEACEVVTANSATWNSVTNKLDTTAFSDVSGNFLTAHQDLSDYQPVSGMTAYLTTGDSANFYTTANESGFITGVDLTPYQTTAGMTAYQPAGDYLTTADSANFYTTANTAGYISEVPDTYLQNTDLSTEDGKVTAISGIPLSAGTNLLFSYVEV